MLKTREIFSEENVRIRPGDRVFVEPFERERNPKKKDKKKILRDMCFCGSSRKKYVPVIRSIKNKNGADLTILFDICPKCGRIYLRKEEYEKLDIANRPENRVFTFLDSIYGEDIDDFEKNDDPVIRNCTGHRRGSYPSEPVPSYLSWYAMHPYSGGGFSGK